MTAPSRQTTADTTASSSSNNTDAFANTDLDDSLSDSEDYGMPKIFLKAAQWSRVLDIGKECISSKFGLSSPKEADADGNVRGFSELVGRDLDRTEKAKSSRLTKLHVNAWRVKDGALEGPPTLDEESESDKDDDTLKGFRTLPNDVKEALVQTLDWAEGKGELPERKTPPSITIPSLESIAAVTSSEELSPISEETGSEDVKFESISDLAPEEIVQLLVDEFGSLTAEGEEERLLFESDAGVLQDIVILGVAHLTTHRLTFHASLLSARPDLHPEQQILKQGPVTIHRPGFHRKRRVWLELSHDMLCTFLSSKDEDRIKPFRAILLSSIRKVHPQEPKHPKRFRIEYCGQSGIMISEAEFDTIESAKAWRGELLGALFMYQHRRASSLARTPDDEALGVRISIPLKRIQKHSIRDFLFKGNVHTFELEGNDDDDGTHFPAALIDQVRRSQILELVMLQKGEPGFDMDALIEQAKASGAASSDAASGDSRVIIDYGTLSFVREEGGQRRLAEDPTEDAIRFEFAWDSPEIWFTRARLSYMIAPTGYFVITPRWVGFWSKCLAHNDMKYRIHTSSLVRVRKVYRKAPRAFGITLEIEGQKDLSFDFSSNELREDVMTRIALAMDGERARLSSLPTPRATSSSFPSSPRSSDDSSQAHVLTGTITESPAPATPTVPASASPGSPGFPASHSSSASISTTEVLAPLHRILNRASSRRIAPEVIPTLPVVVNVPRNLIHHVTERHFVCLTIGSRGDVQPYIALGLGLKAAGHTVTIVTHDEYKDWIEGWGIRHRPAGGDPGALMKLSVEHKMFSPQFFKESLGNFRKWLDDLLVEAWEQCKDADVLLESPSAMAGVHIAEALGIPYFRTFTMPWTKTTSFPHAFLSPPVESASFNVSSYILFDNIFWTATSGQINRWRRNTLKLPNTDMGHMAQSKIPFIYNFSTAVVPKPLDWGDSIIVSGYWFLDNPELGWTPPQTLLEFIAKARADNKPLVYIGFGSITVPNPPALTRSIIKAVLKSDVRAIVSKGWSSRMSKPDEPEIQFPPECYSIDKCPHDWLFPQMVAALHHGGAGTTGASLRAGIPTLIKPWFGDQFFWASRVQKLGAGLRVPSVRSSDIAHALTKATSDRIMKEKAAAVGQRIRSEDGVTTAIKAVYQYINRAGSDRTALD